MDKVEALRRTPLFGGLTVPELQALAERAIEQKLGKGEILFLAGDAARGLYVIVEGAVRAFRVGADGREQVIHVERAGATVGEVPMFDEGAYPSNAGGEEESVLLFIPGTEVRRSILEHPAIALSALKVLAKRIRNCAALVETLSLHDVDRRLAKLLLVEAQARGARRGKGVEFEFSLTHQQVASRIGSVREVVSRAFGRLQQAGLVRVEGKTVIVSDVERFTQYAEGS
ncbi:MAG TPA: Crp/Fnr family transcriptional regulator [Bryobacteraceae bacterium]|nr:Crp/Fnr family transcriptional regulator [Bryobacteraceae bacterium]